MFRPPFLARVAAGAAVYAIEETRRLPTAAVNFPITAISQLLQTTMHVQQFVTSLALKGDAVFDRLSNRAVEQPAWATFDEDEPAQPADTAFGRARTSSFDSFGSDAELAGFLITETLAGAKAGRNGHAATVSPLREPATETQREAEEQREAQREAEAPAGAAETTGESSAVAESTEVAEAEAEQGEAVAPEVATRYDYDNMTLAQLRARLRMLTIDDLTALLDYEQRTRARAPFITMLTNRIATVRAQ
ncbi:lipid droplet-associated protein [Nocardia cyriacigeorgica]|uniref:lipid droplet-associated protein n=1 Tax=Nocardia cyriacigeorgica TaxID=135487 RepID=UPI00030C3E3A|nr:lipid droplet-associated protein [Nocardia cyriacigeorgica]MBF6496886.1 lipid droplet-associated protein [Nocardia cyriacigeorgica]TLF57536.1 lipid droplet-associated protein [Nocardia cyriacigeorgica]